MVDDSAGMRFNTVAQWLRWQEGLHPEEIELGLQRIEPVFKRLNLQFDASRRIISVAGSNGKGSCVAYLSAIFQALGYRVGTYSSPHLRHYNERIQVNGVAIDDDALMRAFADVEVARQSVTLTYFEYGTLAALAHFARARCDILILEVGLGGRLDAVNIIDPDIAVITSIGMDHMDWLGDTREQIALEKAGILRAGRPFVCSEREPPATLLQYADQIGAQSYLLGREFNVIEENDGWHWQGPAFSVPRLPNPAMSGDFQRFNVAAAIMCVAILEPAALKQTDWLNRIVATTRLPGRVQVLQQHPLCLVDVAHNEQAVAGLAQVLRSLQAQGSPSMEPPRIIAVFSILARKDVKRVIAAIAPIVDNWMLAPIRGQASQPTQLVGEEIVRQYAALDHAVSCSEFTDLSAAWKKALAEAKEKDIVVAFGSFFTVLEVLNA